MCVLQVDDEEERRALETGETLEYVIAKASQEYVELGIGGLTGLTQAKFIAASVREWSEKPLIERLRIGG